MASDIARLLNSSKSDTDKLYSLFQEYLLCDDDNLNSSDDEENVEIEPDFESDEDIDMRKNDYDHVLDHVMASPEIVLDHDEELVKSREFR